MKTGIIPAILAISAACTLWACSSKPRTQSASNQGSVNVVSAMKEVMWKGELQGKIRLDTVASKGLIGVGPLEYLRGEILVDDGHVYVSRVLEDGSVQVEENRSAAAPFFVYTHVPEWHPITWPENTTSIAQLETFLDQKFANDEAPFAVRLTGTINQADIHVQNLPEGSQVRSPKEAHMGQVNIPLQNQEVTVVGFYSRKHQGVFTHHDSHLHLHLITQDQLSMGHLDAAVFGSMKLFVSKKVE